eukprot:superscaffoldBa00000664_g6422
MAFKAFTQIDVYEKQAASKEKDKSSIHCLECYDRNVYIGTKDATVQHLILPSSTNGDMRPDQSKTREGRTRKLGSSNPVAQLRAVALFNHLLVLWDRSVTALNMFSLEPVPSLKKIQHVSLFEVCHSTLTAQSACVEMVTSSSRRKVIRIHLVGVDRWEVVKEVPLFQDPVALAIDGTTLCVATTDKYLLCDIKTGSSEELFPHNHSRQHVIVTSVGQGEFLLNGPESLGMFVMKTGICQRPPLQWPQEVLAAGVCFPYILTLQPQVLSVYSMLDQQHKQTVGLSGAKGLLSTSDGVLVFTERGIFSLRLVPLEEQIQTLVGHERVEEALLLLDRVQSHHPLDAYKEERHHNRLALAYVTQTLQEEEETKSDLRVTRGKLQQLLWDSKFYDISTVYERVEPTTLHIEKAILLGRTGEHSQSLQVLVHQGQDPQAAEAYCCKAAQGQDTQFKEALLLTLLKIYLSSEDLTSAAVDLLNNNPQVFAAEKVIHLLPESWSVQLVSQFLVRFLRETFHQRQTRRLQQALAQAELLRHKVIWMQASKTKVRVDKGQVCKVCQRDLAEPQFACNLHGELMHTSCT